MNTPDTLFTKPVKYISGMKRGFIVRPHNVADNSSWGEPYVDEVTGEPIIPGTPGGPNDSAFMGVKDGQWKTIRRSNIQDVGNIDWKGLWIDAGEKREVVTVHGPTQRYWNNGTFDYGDSPTKKHIYSKGSIIGIAPLPVLGACISTQISQGSDGNDVSTKWVVAICVDGEYDIVMINKVEVVLSETNLTEEETHLASQWYRPEAGDVEAVEGWREIGRFLGYTDDAASVPPEAPWFFSADGRFARTMRRCTYNHDGEGTSFDDELYREIQIAIDFNSQGSSVALADSLTAVDQYSRWNSTHSVRQWTDEWTQLSGDSADGYSHVFQEDYMDQEIEMRGSSKIAVDFDPEIGDYGGRWVYGWAKGQRRRSMAEQWSTGVDEPNTPGEDAGGKINNNGSHDGPLPIDEPFLEGDHYEHAWLGFQDNLYLSINDTPTVSDAKYAEISLLWARSGDSSVAAGGAPGDGHLAFIDSYDTWIQYLDLRTGLLCGYVYYNYAAVSQTAPTEIVNQEILWGVLPSSGPSWEYSDTGDWWNYWARPEDSLFDTADGDSRIMYRHDPIPPYYAPAGIASWLRSEFETWVKQDFEEELTYYNYSYQNHNLLNSDKSIWEAYWLDFWYAPFWADQRMPYWNKLTIPEMLRGPETVSKGLFGSTEHYESIISVEITDKNTSTMEVKTASWLVEGDPIESLSGGDRLIPGGLK